jgi:membrane-bound ClpP family serine protease
MLYLFNKTRYGTLVRGIAGVAILVFGIVEHARFAIAIGAILIVWAVFLVLAAWRARDGEDEE